MFPYSSVKEHPCLWIALMQSWLTASVLKEARVVSAAQQLHLPDFCHTK